MYSPQEIHNILKLNDNSDLKEWILPRFDCPPTDYESMPDEDKGWIAIAKGIVDKESRYRRIMEEISKHKPIK